MNAPPPKFLSDNLKPVVSNVEPSAIQNPKWVGVFTIALAFAFGGIEAVAQQPGKIPRIGVLMGGSSYDTLRRGLRDLGYEHGKNIVVEYRFTEGQNERTPSLVAELVHLKVDALVVSSFPGVRAAKKATKTIPIVMLLNADPVEAGFVDSLARPGGNITGVSRLTRELSGKRLELLKEAVPTISRVGVLWDANGVALEMAFNEYEAAARRLKIQLQSLGVRGPNPDLDGVFQTAVKGRAGGMVVITDALIQHYFKRIAELAAKSRLPTMCERSDNVEAGCLMSYAANDAEMFRRAAIYVDKILKGAKPADLPVEQPKDFDLLINLKTAKQIGLTIPQRVLGRADRVVR